MERQTDYIKGKQTLVQREEMTVVGKAADSRISVDKRRLGDGIEESFMPHEEGTGNSSSEEENQYFMPNLTGRQTKGESMRNPSRGNTAVELEFESRDTDLHQAILEDDDEDEDEKNDAVPDLNPKKLTI